MFAVISSCVRCCSEKGLRSFGIQTVGVKCRIFAYEAKLKEVSSVHRIADFAIPAVVSDDVGAALEAGCYILLLKKLMNEMLDVLIQESQKDHFTSKQKSRMKLNKHYLFSRSAPQNPHLIEQKKQKDQKTSHTEKHLRNYLLSTILLMSTVYRTAVLPRYSFLFQTSRVHIYSCTYTYAPYLLKKLFCRVSPFFSSKKINFLVFFI